MNAHLDAQTKKFFLERISRAKTYVEYGCGGSTVLALAESSAKIISVESDPKWAEAVTKEAGKDKERIEICLIDLGEVKEWGYPKLQRVSGLEYASAPWEKTDYADLVLIDGRYRVACFLKTILSCGPGACVIFEDFYPEKDRNYSEVKKVLEPIGKVGRSAVFRIPKSFDRRLAELTFLSFMKDSG